LYGYAFGVTSLNLGLDDELAARLERRAARAGIAPEALATKAIEEYLAHDREPDDPGAVDDPLGWLGRYGNERAQSERIDALLAEGFGR
jgi:hypothetical protein